MAYLDQQHTHKRLAGVTGVALVHVALAVGLTAGLTIKYVAPSPPDILEGRQIPLPPPPPPDDRVPEPRPTTSTTTKSVVMVPDPVIPLTDNATAERLDSVITDDTARVVTPVLDAIVGDAGLSPIPTFTPRSARPRNGPAGWVTNADYPGRALLRGWEGNLTYELSVSPAGRVEDCRIVASTGFELLDDTACRMITRRARFDPASNRSGEQVAGTFRGSVSWQIPDD